MKETSFFRTPNMHFWAAVNSVFYSHVVIQGMNRLLFVRPPHILVALWEKTKTELKQQQFEGEKKEYNSSDKQI